MSLSAVALIAGFAILLVAIADWRKGATGLLRMRLTKEKAPEKFWYAIVLYINIAIGLFWLSGNVKDPEPECGGQGSPCVTVSESSMA